MKLSHGQSSINQPEDLEGVDADGAVVVAVPDGDDDVLAEAGLLLEGGAARRLQAPPRVGRGGRREGRSVDMAGRSWEAHFENVSLFYRVLNLSRLKIIRGGWI